MGILDELEEVLKNYDGVLYNGAGVAGYALIGISNENGTAYVVENGAIVEQFPYQSASIGFILDIGGNGYEVFGSLPEGTKGEFLGLTGTSSLGASSGNAGLGAAFGIVAPNDSKIGYEFFGTVGASLVPVADINLSSLAFTQEYKPSQASSFYIPSPREQAR